MPHIIFQWFYNELHDYMVNPLIILIEALFFYFKMNSKSVSSICLGIS